MRRGFPFIAGLVCGAAVAALALPVPADARLFGKKSPKPDFTAAMPLPPAPPPPVANGAIFQVADGYAPLYEGWRARRVGDPLTIVLVERTVASKSASSKLDSGGGFGLTPPSTGALSCTRATSAIAPSSRSR